MNSNNGIFMWTPVELLVLTVATDRTEGYERFEASVQREGLQLETLGMDEEWRGGDILRLPGGGHKVNLLKKAMEKYKGAHLHCANISSIVNVNEYDVSNDHYLPVNSLESR